MDNYSGYGPEDISAAQYRDFRFNYVGDLSLTEMYWLNISPVHNAAVPGGSNIWFVANMGVPSWLGGVPPPVVPYEKEFIDGSQGTTVFVTVTMMITNTVTGEAWPPDRLNGLEYDGEGSLNYNGGQAWTSVVFSVTGALQKPEVRNNYLPLQQYVFTKDSFGAKDSAHPFQARIDVMDPFAPNSMGYYYGWSKYRFIYPYVPMKYTIEDNPDGRVSISPLVPNWTPVP